jgi:hypothetical protein
MAYEITQRGPTNTWVSPSSRPSAPLSCAVRRTTNRDPSYCSSFSALVRGERVLDGQIVQAEFLLDETEHIPVRFEQSDPDEAIALAEAGAHIGQGQVGNAVSVGAGRAVDDPGCRRVFVFEHGQ